MRNVRLRSFREQFSRLPRYVQAAAVGAYAQFATEPNHPGLAFKQVRGASDIWGVRIGLHYRALAVREGDLLLWFWIGTHAEYDLRIRRL